MSNKKAFYIHVSYQMSDDRGNLLIGDTSVRIPCGKKFNIWDLRELALNNLKGAFPDATLEGIPQITCISELTKGLFYQLNDIKED